MSDEGRATSRRTFLKATALSAVALSAVGQRALAQSVPTFSIVDSNVHLFEWPFRRLPYSRPPELVAKLKHHGIRQAWAGSFEGLLAKDVAGVNERLADECGKAAGFLVAIGTVNPTWPDWEEDLRRCHEVHRMPGIRLHPGYHGYGLDAPEFRRLLGLATDRGLLVQIVLEMEDPRVQHPQLKAPTISPAPLINVLREAPRARVQLLNSWAWLRQPAARPLLTMPNVLHDIAGLEGVGSIGHMLGGNHLSLPGKVPLSQLLFSTYAPFFPVEAMLLRMVESPLSLGEMKAILERNAQRAIAPA